MENKITHFTRTFVISERRRKGGHVGTTSFQIRSHLYHYRPLLGIHTLMQNRLLLLYWS